jgi:hypothetical protein
MATTTTTGVPQVIDQLRGVEALALGLVIAAMDRGVQRPLTVIELGEVVTACGAAAIALETLAMSSTWQPIESAPTNGTVLLVFGSRGVERGWCVAGRWYWDGGSSLVDVPTHWMPLPPAPSKEPQ